MQLNITHLDNKNKRSLISIYVRKLKLGNGAPETLDTQKVEIKTNFFFIPLFGTI